MALQIRFQCSAVTIPGQPTVTLKLGYSIERLRDGQHYDHDEQVFRYLGNVKKLIDDLPENTGDFAGSFDLTLDPTPVSQFTDGNYKVSVHDRDNSNRVFANLGLVMRRGSDEPDFLSLDAAQDIQAGVVGITEGLRLIGRNGMPRSGV